MKKLTLLILITLAANLNAQLSISGTFSPAEDYKWLIAYRLKPGTQEYVADAAVKDGEFSLEIPANSPKGTYRIVYAIPQEEYNFDVIYNGKESIELKYNETEGVSFDTSENNRLYHNYFKDINSLEQEIINFYTSQNTDKKVFLELMKNLEYVQKDYEKKSEGLLVNDFIKANHPYIPKSYEPIQEYVANRKANYFKFLDVKNPLLQSSAFLSDKTLNYVFTALPVYQLSKLETETEIRKNIDTVAANMKEAGDAFQLSIFYSIWNQAVASGFDNTSDFVFNKYINQLAKALDKKDIIETIEIHNRLRTGAVAPEITWKDGKGLKTMSEMQGADNYILVFWSSGCSHCLTELPKLHQAIKENTSIKVLAVGLEDDDVLWKQETERLSGFEHALSLGKWDSEYADLYNISQTPTYFVLDSEKKIIAKPEDYKAVLELLEN